MKLYDKEKNLMSIKFDKIEHKRLFVFGCWSDLIGFKKVNDTHTQEFRFKHQDSDNYYLVGVTNVFSNNKQAANFAASVAMGRQ